MTDDFIVDLKDYIRVERKYPHEAWCDPDDVQAALDEIERLRAALNADAQTIRLHLGEMTAQEMRTVRAAFAWVLAGEKTND